jgi:hypothetical protein
MIFDNIAYSDILSNNDSRFIVTKICVRPLSQGPF